ncbi:hypothetical protein U1Q18_031742 [Sarracenia purpurea var. burkii]
MTDFKESHGKHRKSVAGPVSMTFTIPMYNASRFQVCRLDAAAVYYPVDAVASLSCHSLFVGGAVAGLCIFCGGLVAGWISSLSFRSLSVWIGFGFRAQRISWFSCYLQQLPKVE